MIREMLDQGIIQYSSNPYASLVVLVKKEKWIMVSMRGLQRPKQTDGQGKISDPSTRRSPRRLG